MKSLIELVSESFIWGVGITRPKPGNEGRAALYITAILAASVAVVAAVFLFLLGRMGR